MGFGTSILFLMCTHVLNRTTCCRKSMTHVQSLPTWLKGSANSLAALIMLLQITNAVRVSVTVCAKQSFAYDV